MAEPGRLGPVLTFDVIDNAAFRPYQECRDDQANAFAGSRWSECKDMRRAVITEIVDAPLGLVIPAANVDTAASGQQGSLFHIYRPCPPRGAVQIFRIFGQPFRAAEIRREEDPHRRHTAGDDDERPRKDCETDSSLRMARVFEKPKRPGERLIDGEARRAKGWMS